MISARCQEVEADRPRLGAFGSNAMPKGLPGVIRDEFLQLALSRLVLDEAARVRQ